MILVKCEENTVADGSNSICFSPNTKFLPMCFLFPIAKSSICRFSVCGVSLSLSSLSRIRCNFSLHRRKERDSTCVFYVKKHMAQGIQKGGRNSTLAIESNTEAMSLLRIPGFW